NVGGARKRRLERGAPLDEVAAQLPEETQRRRETQLEAVRAELVTPGERGTKVVVLRGKLVEHRAAVGAGAQLALCPFGKREEVLGVAGSDDVGLPALHELVTSVVADRLEHLEAVLVRHEQAVGDERGERVARRREHGIRSL